jgi:hypothetical protein
MQVLADEPIVFTPAEVDLVIEDVFNALYQKLKDRAEYTGATDIIPSGETKIKCIQKAKTMPGSDVVFTSCVHQFDYLQVELRGADLLIQARLKHYEDETALDAGTQLEEAGLKEEFIRFEPTEDPTTVETIINAVYGLVKTRAKYTGATDIFPTP